MNIWEMPNYTKISFQVTLNGHSAGAQSITIHMKNPDTDRFFHQVILQSTPITLPLANNTEAVKLSDRFSAYLNCTPADTKCLRNQSIDDIIWAQQRSTATPIDFRNPLLWFEQFGPVIDGVEIKNQPILEIAEGNMYPKPLIIGDMSSECASFTYSLFPTAPPQVGVLSVLTAYLGRYTLPVLQQYWTYWSLDIRRLLSELFSDYLFVCSSRNVARSIESFGKPVYSYLLNHTINDDRVWDNYLNADVICSTPGFTCHNTDVFFSLYSLALSGYKYTPFERRLSQQMMAYWANFFHTGDPNNYNWRKQPDFAHNIAQRQGYDKSFNQDNRLFWHQYSRGNGWPSLYFQTPGNKVIDDFKRDECDLLDEVGYNGPVGPLKPNAKSNCI